MSPTAPPPLPVRAPQLRIALLLAGAGALAALALFPYLAAMMPQKLAAVPLPLWVLALVQALQAGLLSGLLAWLGLLLGARHGLDAPWLRALVYHQPYPAGGRWWQAAVLGALAALLVIGLAHLGPQAAGTASTVNGAGWAWRGALASFYGGIVEETQSRLFVVSLLVWLLALLRRGRAQAWMYLLAIALAALLFGAGHLPAAISAGLASTPMQIVRIVLLNAIAGVVFGWLFWRRGLEHAMLGHFCADLVLHVAAPLLSLA